MIEMEFTLNNILNYLRLSMPGKRYFSRQHDIKHNTYRPNIYFHVVLLQKNFWCDIIRRPIHGVHCCLLGKIFRKSKINHFDASQVPSFVKHKIFWFYIPMGYLLRVQIVQSQKKLFHNVSSCLFGQIFSFDNVMKKFTSFAKF